MSNVGYDTWFQKKCPTVFVVHNVSQDKRTIRLFQYPIPYDRTRDLMMIPFVSEADIRHALLKGELKVKILANEIRIVDSNIDLTQFDDCHRQFLIDAGVIKGVDSEIFVQDEGGGKFKASTLNFIGEAVTAVNDGNGTADIDISGTGGASLDNCIFLNLHVKQNVALIGAKNGVNKTFTVPVPDKFLNGPLAGSDFRIIVRHNGRALVQDTDYIVIESGGVGTGYDTVKLLYLAPSSSSSLVADYTIDVGISIKTKQDIALVGTKDGTNRIFTVPIPDKFINGPVAAGITGAVASSDFRILIRHNGRGLIENVDYIVHESGGTGTGFDTIIFISFIPASTSSLVADYVLFNLRIKQNVILVGNVDGTNRTFTVPMPDKFVNGPLCGNDFHILVRHDGRGLIQNVDYIISESGGVGTGFDTVKFISFVPGIGSTVIADYVVQV